MDVWHRLDNFRCPIEGCKGGQTPCQWLCDKDYSVIQLSQFGYMKCSKRTGSRPHHYGPVYLWRWKCGGNSDHHFTNFENSESDCQGFILALSHAVQLTEHAGAAWVASLCFELDEQYKGNKLTTDLSRQRTTRLGGSPAQVPSPYKNVTNDYVPEPESSNKPEDTEKNKRTCNVCMETQVNAVLIPCGHTICMEDALQLQQTNGKCHICRTKFTGINKLFLN